MQALQPSFMLLADFTFPPDGDIQLGSILPASKQTKRPDARRPLNQAGRNQISPAPQHQAFKPWSWDSSKNSSIKTGLAADLSIFTGIGGGFDVDRSNGAGLHIRSDQVDVEQFRPSPGFLAEALRHDVVDRYTNKFLSPSVYMVTGRMIAHGARITKTARRGRGIETSVSADVTSLGVPLKVGPEVGYHTDEDSSLLAAPEKPFVLAYQLIKIKRKRDGSAEDSDFNKFALFSDEVPVIPQTEEEALTAQWDVSAVDSVDEWSEET